MKPTAESKVRVLVVGPDSLTKDVLLKFLPLIELIELAPDIELLLEAIEPPPSIVICTIPAKVADASEIGQLLSSMYTGVPLFLVTHKDTKLNRKILLKNGYKDIFLMPIDKSLMTEILDDTLSKLRSQGKVFKPVKIIDLEPDTNLDFDTFLHLSANNKYLKYSAAGDSIDKERTDKLKRHDIGSLYIATQDVKKFYDYTAFRLKDLQGDNKLSETEKADRMKSAVRDLFGNMFSDSAGSFDGGKGLVTEGQKILKSYISQSTGQKAYDRILAIVANNSDFYSHASNVASYASLFALGLGLANVEAIAMAALLHDLGLSKVPDDILAKDPEDFTKSDKETYEKHVEHTLDVIREKKLILSDLVRKIIVQHHEKFNGMGYPKQLAGDRICIEAQILSLADKFDYMTVLRKGKPRIKPKDAMARILADCFTATRAEFASTLVKKVQALF